MANRSKSGDKTTIREVAKKAGVSVATVSRVLNSMEIVREDKKKRVLDAIAELKYIPSSAARSLGKENSFKIAVIVPNIINSAMAEVVRGIFETLHTKGMDILLYNSNEDPLIEKRSFDSLSDKMVDGAIFVAQCGSRLDFSKLVKKMPIVIIERSENNPGVDKFEIDDEKAMNELVNHLYLLGHRKIALLSGIAYSYNAQVRENAFKNAMEQYELSVDEDLIVNCRFSFSGGSEGFKELLAGKVEFTAVICVTDTIAVGATGAALKLGYKIPEDFSITGYDGFPETANLYPAVTSISYPGYKLGCLAGNSINGSLDRNNFGKIKGEKVILDVSLIKRDTTGKARKKNIIKKD